MEPIGEVTPDGQHLFVRLEQVDPSDPISGAIWHVFSVAEGERLGRVPYQEAAHSPCVVPGRVFYFVEAMDLNDDGRIQRHCVYWGWFGFRVLQRNEYHSQGE